jgi:hypothetical protein
MKKQFVLGVLVILFLAGIAGAAPPTLINYEGRLTSTAGASLSGAYNMRFSLCSDLAGANVVWGPETHSGVTVSNGVFAVLLGNITPVTTAELSGSTVYLKLEIANPADSTTNYETLTPLSRLVSVAYALKATEADRALKADEAATVTGGYVSQIIAGSNITVTPTTGAGAVTISAAGGGDVVDGQTIGRNTSGSLEVKDGGITDSKIASTVSINTSGDIAATSFYGDGSGLTGIVATNIADLAVTTTKIATAAVTAEKITDGTITNIKLAGSITDDKLSQITTADKVAAAALAGKVPMANLDVGTGAGQLITLDASAKLPPVDGSQLTNISASTLADNSVTTNKIANSNVTAAKLAGSIPDSLLNPITTADKVSGSALTGLASIQATAGVIPPVNLNVGTGPNQLVVLTGSGQLPAVDGSQLTGISGQANTIANVGTVGVGLFKQKAGVTLEVYKINPATNKLSIGIISSDRVDLDVNEGNLSLNNIGGAPLGVTKGGTGNINPPTNGQLLIGNGTGYTLANLTPGQGIAIANGVGSATVSMEISNLPVTSSLNPTDYFAVFDGTTQKRVTKNTLLADVTGALKYKGAWNVATNTPLLASGTGEAGSYFIVSVAGTRELDGQLTWEVNDWVVFNNTAWDRIAATNNVTSVFSRIGAITAQSGDYTAAQVGLGNVTNDAQIPKSLGTTKGDIVVYTNTATPVRLPIGVEDQVLVVDTLEATGMKWATDLDGTVSYVGLSLPADFSVVGSPVTVSGEIAATWASQPANSFLAAPNGSLGTPAFRAIVPADIPTLNQSTTGTAASATNVTGTVAILNGGTGATTQQNALNALTNVSAATIGYILAKDASGNATFEPVSAVAVPYTGAAGDVDLGSHNLTVSGQGQFNTVQSSSVHPPINSTTALQFRRTDDSTVVMNVDTTNSRVGIGTTAPGQTLSVNGSANVTSSLVVGGTTPLPGILMTIYDDGPALGIKANTAGQSSYLDFRNSAETTRGLFGVDGAGLSGATNQFSMGTWSNSPLVLFTNQTEKMRITSAGNVGVGTTEPLAKLSVKDGNISIEGTGSYYGDGSYLTGVTAVTANYAVLAGTATTAATAITATSAGYATLAGTATTAATATNAGYATLAGTATTAASADFAVLSGTATNAGFAALAGTATTAATANYAILSGTASNAADLIIAGQTSGDMLYFNGTNWVRTNPTWTRSASIISPFVGADELALASNKNIYLDTAKTRGLKWNSLQSRFEFNGNLYSSGSLEGSGLLLTNLNAANINSGILGRANGGLGIDTSAAAQGDILYFNGTSWARLPAGTSGQFLKSFGSGANPAWTNLNLSRVVTTEPYLTPLNYGDSFGLNTGAKLYLDDSRTRSLRWNNVSSRFEFNGIVSGESFVGNGTSLTNLNAANITNGVVGLANGGLGSDTAGADPYSILYYDGTKWVALSPGPVNYRLYSGGAGAPPTWGPGASGTVTRISTGPGLKGGNITAAGTIEVKYDNDTIGLNVYGSLEAIRTLMADYATLAGTASTAESVTDGAVTTTKIAAAAVTAAKMATHSVTEDAIAASGSPGTQQFLRWSGTGLEWANISAAGSTEPDYLTIGRNLNGSLEVTPGGLDATRYQARSITSEVIGRQAIKAENMATHSVTEDAIAASGSPGPQQFLRWSGSGLEWANIATAGSTEPDLITIGRNVNGSFEVRPGGIDASRLAAGSVTGDALAAGAVSAAKLADNTITGGKLAANVNVATTGYITAESVRATNLYGSGTNLTGVTADYAVLTGTASKAADLNIAGAAKGDLLVFDGSKWTRMFAGTLETFLQSAGPGEIPIWQTDYWVTKGTTIEPRTPDTNIGMDSDTKLFMKSGGGRWLTWSSGNNRFEFNGNLYTSGFYGDGANLTNLSASNISTGMIGRAVGGLGIDTSGAAQGDILYFNGTSWDRLPAGTSGYNLKTQGTGANPAWALDPWTRSGTMITPTTAGDSLTTTGSMTAAVLTATSVGMGLNVAGSAEIVGNLGVGTANFDPTNPERLLVQAVTGSYNVISGTGNADSYLQLNIQNNNAGANASSDLVATANNGSETTNFVDLGINSSGYSNSGFTIGGANDAYLYNEGQNLTIGTSTAGKAIKFHTGGTLSENERMRIDGSGKVGIGTTEATSLLTVAGTIEAKLGGIKFPNGSVQTAAANSTASVSSVGAGRGLTTTANPITTTGTISIDANVVVTTSDAQTLTNKALTAPTINTAVISGGTIDNAVIGGTTAAVGKFTALSSTGQYTNTVAVGTAPMVITSTTEVANLNASRVGGKRFLANTATWTATAANTKTFTDANVTTGSNIIASWGNSSSVPVRFIVNVVPTAGSFTVTFSGNLTSGNTHTLNYLVIN